MAEAEASKSVAIRGRLGTWPSMAVGVVVVGGFESHRGAIFCL